MRLCVRLVVWGGLLAAHGATPAAAPTEAGDPFAHLWSKEADLVAYGAVSAVRRIDSADAPETFVELLVRTDSVQRGEPADTLVWIRVEGDGRTALGSGEPPELGTRGLWFARDVRRSGSHVSARLLRFVGSGELQNDPVAADALLRFVVQDTVDGAVPKNVHELLDAAQPGESLSTTLELSYDDGGRLRDIATVGRSGNPLYDDLVLDAAIFVHRAMTVPAALKATRVTISRTTRRPRKPSATREGGR